MHMIKSRNYHFKSTLISLKKNLQQKMDTLSHVTFDHSHLIRIVYLMPSNFHYVRGLTDLTRIQQCEYSKCAMSFNESDLNKRDAVIFNMIKINKWKYNLSLSSLQNPGQIWTWTQHERPTLCDKSSTPGFRSGVRWVFNWTMTYSKRSDIYLPYGVLKVSKVAKIRNRYNQVPHLLAQDTNGKVTNSQKTPQTRAKRSALSQQVTTKHI